MNEYTISAVNGETGEPYSFTYYAASIEAARGSFEEQEAARVRWCRNRTLTPNRIVSIVATQPEPTSQTIEVGQKIPFPIDETDRVFSVVTDSVGGVYVTDSTDTVLAVVDLTYVDATSDDHEAQLLAAVYSAFEQLESNIRYPEVDGDAESVRLPDGTIVPNDEVEETEEILLNREALRGESVRLDDGTDGIVARVRRDGSVYLQNPDRLTAPFGPYERDEYRVVSSRVVG
jgi:hypothetical protein